MWHSSREGNVRSAPGVQGYRQRARNEDGHEHWVQWSHHTSRRPFPAFPNLTPQHGCDRSVGFAKEFLASNEIQEKHWIRTCRAHHDGRAMGVNMTIPP